MGKRGPKPTPTNLRVLRGDRKDRINTDEPQPAEGLPVLPDGVADEVREVWDYTLAQLAQMNLATPADRDALLAYCEAVVQHRRASRALVSGDLIVEGMHGRVRNPLVSMQRDAATLMRQLGSDFGLNPSARSELKVSAASGKPASSASRLLG